MFKKYGHDSGKSFKWITVLLCESDSLLLSAENKRHVGQGVSPGMGIKKIFRQWILFGNSKSTFIIMTPTHEEAQPISWFSQRSLVSKSIFHFWVFLTPDCMALRVGTKIRTLRVLICSSGTPVKAVMS